MAVVVIMTVVVAVLIEGERALRSEAEQGAILRCARYDLGCALAADVAVEADHSVDALMTTCRSWLTRRTPHPSSFRTRSTS